MAHKLLRAMCKGNRMNQKTLFQYVPHLQAQVGTGMKATDTLLDLFRDNRELLLSVTTDMVAGFAGLIVKDKNARFVSFLKILCSCMGQPVTRNQKKIVKHVLKNQAKTQLLLPWRISWVLRLSWKTQTS